jgi:8-oxo-dGTP pyrophosphatase MutT (NUDIX family)
MVGVSAGAIVVNRWGHVLLVRHTYGMFNWEIPGGAGEPNESPAETAVREAREETGLRVRAVAVTGWYYDTTVDKMGGVFRCEIEGEETEPVADGDEIAECRYWPPDALPRPISDWTVLRIEDALSGREMPLPTQIGPRRWLGSDVPSA